MQARVLAALATLATSALAPGPAVACAPSSPWALRPCDSDPNDRHPDDRRRSLEDLLAEAQAEREKIHAQLLPQVTLAVTKLDELERRAREDRAEAIVAGLVRLGSDAAPLLIQFLDPGEGASKAQIFRSERIAEALLRLRAVSVTDILLERARTASLLGRLNALTVLGGSPEPERVAVALEALARETVDEASNPYRSVRLAALRALARLGGAAAGDILGQTLRDGDLASAEGALEALTDVRLASAAQDVLGLLVTGRGSALASRIAAYLDAVPSALEASGALEGVITLCARDNVSREAKLALLDTLRRSDLKPPSSVKRELQTLRESLDQGVRNAALVYLARNRDRSAKRELFDPWDTQVKDSRNSPVAFEGRAQLNYLIGDHNAAVRDWRDALKLQSERNGVRSSAPFVGIARSLAQLGKYKEAAEYIDQAPISMTSLHDLARDRDFEGMLASKYREAFHLPEDGQ